MNAYSTDIPQICISIFLSEKSRLHWSLYSVDCIERIRHIYLLLFAHRSMKRTEENMVIHFKWAAQVFIHRTQSGRKISEVQLYLVLIIKSWEDGKRKGEEEEKFTF